MANQTIQIGSAFRSFSTSFSGTENPLSEGGIWLSNTNTLLTAFQKTGGRAVGLAVGAGAYDDSAALLDGFGNDVEMTVTVFKDATIDTDATHEVELLMRATQSASVSVQYEALFSFNGNIQFVRWFNNGGSQDFEFLSPTSGTESLGRALITGDRVRARCQGSTFTLQVIEADNTVHTLGVYTNTAIASGKPGIGAFTRAGDGGNLTKFCLEDFSITEV